MHVVLYRGVCGCLTILGHTSHAEASGPRNRELGRTADGRELLFWSQFLPFGCFELSCPENAGSIRGC